MANGTTRTLMHSGETTMANAFKNQLNRLQDLLDATRAVDFLAPLALRVYLVPIFWMTGTKKFAAFDDTVAWFGNPDWGLGLPLPALMVVLAAGSELLGAILLALGLGVPEAFERAKDFITKALKGAVPLGSGHGPVDHLWPFR